MTHDIDQGSEKRRQIRHPLTGNLTGRMIAVASGSTVPCVAVDVSISGLRIVQSLDLPPGMELSLKMSDQETRLVVVWCRREATRPGYYTAGLMTADPEANLERMFIKEGMLDATSVATKKS